MEIRAASEDDWPLIWPFYRAIVQAGETYAIDPEITEEEARREWMHSSPGATFVAVDDDGARRGLGERLPEPPGRGGARGVGELHGRPGPLGAWGGAPLGEQVIDWAREQGFRSMQFNAVVETNTRAVALWKSLGFEVLATVPEAFRHPTEGYVGLLVMYRRL